MSLIAAAPDLLDSAKNVLELSVKIISTLQAAIAKAEGRRSGKI